MKKILVITLIALTTLGAVQAQNKAKTNKSIQAEGQSTALVPKTNDADVIKLNDDLMGMDMPLFETLKKRATYRQLKPDELDPAIVSSLLWATYGINRPEENRRVVPSAVNVQEFDIYLFNNQGVYKYEAKENLLKMVLTGDHRAEISTQKHFAEAPISILIVANYDRMGVFKNPEDRDFYAAVDCGYVSQNIYLFCASAQLGTVACGGINRDALAKMLGIKNGRPMLAHPVGRL